MGLGSLATIGAGANLSIVVIEIEHYAETGIQPSDTSRGWISPASRRRRFAHAATVRTQAEFGLGDPGVASRPGPVFTAIKVVAEPAAIALPPRDGPYLRSRFRAALLGEARAVE